MGAKVVGGGGGGGGGGLGVGVGVGGGWAFLFFCYLLILQYQKRGDSSLSPLLVSCNFFLLEEPIRLFFNSMGFYLVCFFCVRRIKRPNISNPSPTNKTVALSSPVAGNLMLELFFEFSLWD